MARPQRVDVGESSPILTGTMRFGKLFSYSSIHGRGGEWAKPQARAMCSRAAWIHPRKRSSRLRVMRWTRGSGPCGRPKCECGGMWPGGAARPCDQKIVEALKTKFPFGPG